MLNISPKKYFFSFIILFAFVILVPFPFILYKIKAYQENEHRIYGVRKVQPEYRASLVTKFIEAHKKNLDIVILGDSQPNGHRYPNNFIFSFYLSKNMKRDVLNLAITDGRIKDNIFILDYMIEQNIKSEYIIFNINQSHLNKPSFQHIDINNSKNYELYALFDSLNFLKMSFAPNASSNPKEMLVIAKYEKYFDYNQSSLNDYKLLLDEFMQKAKKVSPKVLIYMTPHSPKSMHYNEFSLHKMEKLSSDFLLLCQKNNIECIDLQQNFNDDDFLDIVHFNSNGHKKMAVIIQKYIDKFHSKSIISYDANNS